MSSDQSNQSQATNSLPFSLNSIASRNASTTFSNNLPQSFGTFNMNSNTNNTPFHSSQSLQTPLSPSSTIASSQSSTASTPSSGASISPHSTNSNPSNSHTRRHASRKQTSIPLNAIRTTVDRALNTATRYTPQDVLTEQTVLKNTKKIFQYILTYWYFSFSEAFPRHINAENFSASILSLFPHEMLAQSLRTPRTSSFSLSNLNPNPFNRYLVENKYHSFFTCFMDSLGKTNKPLIRQLGFPSSNVLDNIFDENFTEYLNSNSTLQPGHRDLGYFYVDPNTLPARYPLADYRFNSIRNFLADRWGSISRFTDQKLKRQAENIRSIYNYLTRICNSTTNFLFGNQLNSEQMSNWKPRYTPDGVFFDINEKELPLFAHCKKKLIAFHIHWNFLNKRLVYFTSNCAGNEESKNRGTVILRCIKEDCQYYLCCKRAKFELFDFPIDYYRVEKCIDHTCSPITPTETDKLKTIFELWKDKNLENGYSFSVGDRNYRLTPHEIMKYFLMDHGHSDSHNGSNQNGHNGNVDIDGDIEMGDINSGQYSSQDRSNCNDTGNGAQVNRDTDNSNLEQFPSQENSNYNDNENNANGNNTDNHVNGDTEMSDTDQNSDRSYNSLENLTQQQEDDLRAAIRRHAVYTKIEECFEGFKPSWMTLSTLTHSLQQYYIYVINPKYLQSTKSNMEKVALAMENLLSFHPHFAKEYNSERNTFRFFRRLSDYFQKAKNIIGNIATVFILLSLRKPKASFYVRYDPMGPPQESTRNEDDASTSTVSNHVNIMESDSDDSEDSDDDSDDDYYTEEEQSDELSYQSRHPTACSNRSNGQSGNDSINLHDFLDDYEYEPNDESGDESDEELKGLGNIEDADYLSSNDIPQNHSANSNRLPTDSELSRSAILREDGLSFYNTNILPLIFPETEFASMQNVGRIKFKSLRPLGGFDFRKRIVDYYVPQELSAKRLTKIMHSEALDKDFNDQSAFSSEQLNAENETEIVTETAGGYLRETLSIISNAFRPNNIVDRLIAGASITNDNGQKYLDLVRVDTMEPSLEEEPQLPQPVRDGTVLVDFTESDWEEYRASKEPQTEEPSNNSQQPTPAGDEQDTPPTPSVRRGRKPLYPKPPNEKYISNVVENITQIVKDYLPRLFHTTEVNTYCRQESCPRLVGLLAAESDRRLRSLTTGGGRRRQQSHGQGQTQPPTLPSQSDNSSFQKIIFCGELSHYIADFIVSVLRLAPIDPIKLGQKFYGWFPQPVIGLFQRMNRNKTPYSPTEIFYAPDISKNFIDLVTPVISIDGTFLKKAQYGKYIMYVATGMTANETVINLAIGFYPAENAKGYASFLTELYRTYKDYFQKYNPAIISDGDKGITPAMKKALPRSLHLNCAKHLSERAKSIKFSGPNRRQLKKRFLALFHHLQYMTNPQDLRAAHDEILELLSEHVDQQHHQSDDLVKYIKKRVCICYALSQYPRYNQMTSNAVETVNKELLSIREADPWTIIPEFDRLTWLQIEKKKKKYYLKQYAGKFVNDDVLLAPGLVNNLSYYLLYLRDFDYVQVSDSHESHDSSLNCQNSSDTYAVWHREDSLFVFFLKISSHIRPCDFPGLYTSLHKPFGYTFTPTRRKRVDDAYSRQVFRVDLANRTCSCTYFQQLERPCIHAMKVILSLDKKVSDYCHERYKMDFAIRIFHNHVSSFDNSPPFKISELLQVKTLVDQLCFGLGRGLANNAQDARKRGRRPEGSNSSGGMQNPMSTRKAMNILASSLEQLEQRIQSSSTDTRN